MRVSSNCYIRHTVSTKPGGAQPGAAENSIISLPLRDPYGTESAMFTTEIEQNEHRGLRWE
jgi:hypothetical protein